MDADRRPRTTPDACIVLGVDPGLRITGFGVLRLVGVDASLIDIGVIRTKGSTPERLAQIYAGLRAAMQRNQVEEVAVEQPFVALNTKSAFAIGEARAAALLAAAHEGLSVAEYTPTAVKQSVAGYGRGSKEQIGEMVRLQFGLAAVPTPADASDAAAIALCHAAHRRTASLARMAR